MVANTEKSKPSKRSVSNNEPEFIPGIYNCCDRWCERCRFTDRCRVYHSEQEYIKRHPYNDDDNDAFFAHLASIFEETMQVLEQKDLEMGIDLDSLLRLLAMLEKVRRVCYELFPGAMEFVRPGLDER